MAYISKAEITQAGTYEFFYEFSASAGSNNTDFEVKHATNGTSHTVPYTVHFANVSVTGVHTWYATILPADVAGGATVDVEVTARVPSGTATLTWDEFNFSAKKIG